MMVKRSIKILLFVSIAAMLLCAWVIPAMVSAEEINADMTYDDIIESEDILVAGPTKSKEFIEAYVTEHPDIIWEFSKYLPVFELVQNFETYYPDVENYNTYNAMTGTLNNPETGFCVTFHQNLAADDPFGGYTDEEYAAMCAIAIRELDAEDVDIGYFGNTEVSFTCMDKEKALRFSVQHNQNSIYCASTYDTPVNPKWDSSLNPIRGVE